MIGIVAMRYLEGGLKVPRASASCRCSSIVHRLLAASSVMVECVRHVVTEPVQEARALLDHRCL